MKNFDWTQFTRKIAIEASLQEIYDAWTIPAELERWFLSDASFLTSKGEERNKSESIQTNDTYAWKWYLWEGTETGTIRTANKKDTITFTFAADDCIVTVSLKPYSKGTIVSLHQGNIPTTDKDKEAIRLGCDSGWSFFLVNLKSVYEGGLDLRNKNPKLKKMLNA